MPISITRVFKHLYKPRNIGMALSILVTTACTTIAPIDNPHVVKQVHSNDIWQRIRDNYGMPDLYNNEVLAKESYYSTRADYVGRMAERSGDFMYIIMNEIERRRMPSELALLPFVESAFVTSAKSSAKASGLWQFMPATGRHFDLAQNRFADQRNDVVASTNAALTYLQKLHDQFGDWHLALAAYNWGEGNVGRAVNRSGGGGYQDIKMPTETRQYVPKLQAIKNIVSNPAQYGIELPNIHNRARHEAITLTRDIDMTTAAQLAGMSLEEFKRINPAYKNSVMVAALESKILVPTERADNFREAFSDRSRQLASLTTYTTYSSEALDDIASKYSTDAYRLRELNGIPYNHSYVQAGSTLIVPRVKSDDEIPYLALNSSVRTSTGGAGFNGFGTDPYPAPSTLGDGGLIATNSESKTRIPADSSDKQPGFESKEIPDDALSALINNPPAIPESELIVAPAIVAQTELPIPAPTTQTPSTGGDRLSTLINTPPPIYDTPKPTSSALTDKDNMTGLTVKDLPDNVIASDPTRVQIFTTPAHVLKDKEDYISMPATKPPEDGLRLDNPPMADTGVRIDAPSTRNNRTVVKTNNRIKTPAPEQLPAKKITTPQKSEAKLSKTNSKKAASLAANKANAKQNAANASKGKLTQKPSKEAAKKSDLSTVKSAAKSNAKAPAKPTQKSTPKAAEKPAAKANAKTDRKSSAKSIEKPTNKVVSKAASKTTANTSAKKPKIAQTSEKPKKK